MASPIDTVAKLCATPAAAVRWSCLLEATAPKAGNVHPGRSFDDLTYSHFVTAAEIAATTFATTEIGTCTRALDAVTRTFERTATNVNLGILLLLAPLVAADETGRIESIQDWTKQVAQILDSLTSGDSASLFAAIRVATAGGLGEVDEMDVNDFNDPAHDIVAAMVLAQDRDRIARQFAGSFDDLITNVVPVVEHSIAAAGDLLIGISHAQIALLALEPDTLIARKQGDSVAQSVQQRARRVNIADSQSMADFDAFLRSDRNQLNPGTTADLIAAALYVLLRTPNREPVK